MLFRSPPQRSIDCSYWYAAWDDESNSPIFGRLFVNSKHHVTIQHWVRNVDISGTTLTLSSQNVLLAACPGCSLNNPTKLFRHKNTKPNKRTSHLPCVFNIEHEETVSLKDFHKGMLHPTKDNTLRCTYFHVSHLIRELLRPHLSTAPPLNVPNSDSNLGLSHPLKYGLYFHYNSEYLDSSTPTRPFVKAILDA